jgi:hypothetical protein
VLVGCCRLMILIRIKCRKGSGSDRVMWLRLGKSRQKVGKKGKGGVYFTVSLQPLETIRELSSEFSLNLVSDNFNQIP